MKRLTRVVIPFLRLATLVFLCFPSASSQIRQIDSSKLPDKTPVQHAYTDLLPIDQFARIPQAAWHFPVPKSEMESRFSQALETLREAQRQAPDNRELRLLTGLVAHLTYNLGIEEANDPALKLLQPLAYDDFRAAWFLGMQQCQSNDSVGGMRQLLHIESSTQILPRDFWQDYAICATLAGMPVHAVRAYDNAQKSPGDPPAEDLPEQIARERIKRGTVIVSYPVKQAWHEDKIVGGTRFTSYLCGLSFTTKGSSHLNLTLSDAAYGTCPITINTDRYPGRFGSYSASILLVTQAARPGESLEAFSQRILETFSHGLLKNPRDANKTPLVGIHCPVASCLSSEIITNKLYKAQGGAHLLAVFFKSEQPADPGLCFETPQPLQKVANNSGQPSAPQPEAIPQRYNGALYTFLTLDASQDIYPRVRVDFEDILKSIVVDSK